jgi:ribosome-binding protein aMBF1 (putative translation factor)
MAQTDGSATRASATGLPNFKLVAVNPNHVDERLGGFLREKRASRGLSPVELATNLRINPEDISAYESGTKRISTDLSRQIAKALNFRPVGHSYSSNRKEGRAPRSDPRVTEATPDEVSRLEEAFFSIRDATVRKSILDLVDELAGSV